jgi:hypothetical protein
VFGERELVILNRFPGKFSIHPARAVNRFTIKEKCNACMELLAGLKFLQLRFEVLKPRTKREIAQGVLSATFIQQLLDSGHLTFYG